MSLRSSWVFSRIFLFYSIQTYAMTLFVGGLTGPIMDKSFACILFPFISFIILGNFLGFATLNFIGRPLKPFQKLSIGENIVFYFLVFLDVVFFCWYIGLITILYLILHSRLLILVFGLFVATIFWISSSLLDKHWVKSTGFISPGYKKEQHPPELLWPWWFLPCVCFIIAIILTLILSIVILFGLLYHAFELELALDQIIFFTIFGIFFYGLGIYLLKKRIVKNK